jgi:cupin 2 domain-containing protein
MIPANLFQAIPTDLPEEITHCLLSCERLKIERIVSKGHSSPPDFWYDQDQNEWVLLIAGEARLQLENETIHLQPGDYFNIPAHVKHRVAWTAPEHETIWLAVFY